MFNTSFKAVYVVLVYMRTIQAVSDLRHIPVYSRPIRVRGRGPQILKCDLQERAVSRVFPQIDFFSPKIILNRVLLNPRKKKIEVPLYPGHQSAQPDRLITRHYKDVLGL